MGWYERMTAGAWSADNAKTFLKDHEGIIMEAGFVVSSSMVEGILNVNLVPLDPTCNCAKLSLLDNFFGGTQDGDTYITADDTGRPIRFTQTG